MAGDYRVEVTSSVLWLRDFGVDVSCVKYSIYQDGETIYADFDRIIPIQGAEEYQINLANRNAEADAARGGVHQCKPEYRDYWRRVNEYISENEDLVRIGIRASERWAERGEQWYLFRLGDKNYDVGLRLYGTRRQVGVCVVVDTRDADGAGFFSRMEDARPAIEQALGGAGVVWGTKDLRTVAAKTSWNEENTGESIRWQFDRIREVVDVLDRL